jgi:ABC transporter
VPDGEPRPCGNAGCLERYLSCEARERRAREIGIEGWIAEAAPLLPRAIAVTENLFDPQTIVIGGIVTPDVLSLLAAAEPFLHSVAERGARKLPLGGAPAVRRGRGIAQLRITCGFRGAIPASRSAVRGRRRAGARSRSRAGQSGDADVNNSATLLHLENVVKNYGAIQALRGISFGIAAGEVVALPGDNGAGKSTLVKIISGGLPATSGRIGFDGVERRFESPAEAKAAGIETVYQDLPLCTNVDVVANFFMGREILKRFLGIPILQEDAGGRREGDGQCRGKDPIAARQCRASFRRSAAGDRIEPVRPLGRQARAARRALRGPWRRTDAAWA